MWPNTISSHPVSGILRDQDFSVGSHTQIYSIRVAFILLIYHVGNLKLQEIKLPSLDHTAVEVEINLKVSSSWDQQGKRDEQVPTSPQIV